MSLPLLDSADPASEAVDIWRGRWEAREWLWRNSQLPRGTIRNCGRTPTGRGGHYESGVDVLRMPDGRITFAGVQHCGSVWACPVCSAQIMSRRADRLQKVIDGWHADGYRVGFVTLTLRHTSKMRLADVWDKLIAAWGRTIQGSWTRLQAEMGVPMESRGKLRGRVPIIRTVEVTRGRHGWHPHLHCLVFVRDEEAWNHFSGLLMTRWVDAVRAVGAHVDADKALHAELINPAKDSAGRVGKYLAKTVFVGSGSHSAIHWEAAGGLGKTAKGASRTPWEILEDATAGDVTSAKLWAEWEAGSRRRQQMVVPTVLLDRYSLRGESDAEALAATDERTEVWVPWAQAGNGSL